MTDQVWGLAVPPDEKLVLLAIARWADDEGRISLPVLMRHTGMGRYQLRRALRRLQDRGVLLQTEAQAGFRAPAWRIETQEAEAGDA